MKIKTLFITVIAFALISTVAMAKTITLTWSYPTADQASITSFRIWEGDTSGQYGTVPLVDNIDPTATTYSFTIPDTDACYYFTLDAYNSIYDMASGKSNEVSVCITNGVATFPTSTLPTPAILNLQVTE